MNDNTTVIEKGVITSDSSSGDGLIWKSFNTYFVSLIAIGVIAFIFSIPSFNQDSLGAILFGAISWLGRLISVIGLIGVLGYFAYKMGKSLWCLPVGLTGVMGLAAWPMLVIGYLIILTLYKGKEGKISFLVFLTLLAVVTASYFYN